MKIPGALREAMGGINKLPGVATIFTAVDAALFGFDDGVDAIGVGAGNGNADAAKNAGRQAVAFETLPGGSVVAGFVEAAAGAAADGGPGIALGFVERSKKNVWIGWIEG